MVAMARVKPRAEPAEWQQKGKAVLQVMNAAESEDPSHTLSGFGGVC